MDMAQAVAQYNAVWSRAHSIVNPPNWLEWATDALPVALYFGGPNTWSVDLRHTMLDLIINKVSDRLSDEEKLFLAQVCYYRGYNTMVLDLLPQNEVGFLWVSRMEKRKHWDPFWRSVFWPNFKPSCVGPLSYEDTGRLFEFLKDPWNRQVLSIPKGPVALDEDPDVRLLYSGDQKWRVREDRVAGSVDDWYGRFTDFGTLIAWVGSTDG